MLWLKRVYKEKNVTHLALRELLVASPFIAPAMTPYRAAHRTGGL
jgi:hypothetical protein